ncbi:MAG: hypothetical protein HOA17_06060 [Candidatus Melainabacteria bacterium]|nr:hypothetical protein [Candidatus Melainabacteria bacterium]
MTLVTILGFINSPVKADSGSSLENTVATSSDAVYVLEEGGTVLNQYNSSDMSTANSVTLSTKARGVIVSGDQPIVVTKTKGSYTLSAYDPSTLTLTGETSISINADKKSGKGSKKNDDDDSNDDDSNDDDSNDD